MTAYTGQTRVSDAYRFWETQVRVACAAARPRPLGSIRAVTLSHGTDGLSSDEVASITGLAGGLAHDAGLKLETESHGVRLVLRFSGFAQYETAASARRSAPAAGTRWHRLAWLGGSSVKE